MKLILISITAVFCFQLSLAQSVAINNDATPPNPGAILDIKSLDKGLLIPRTTTASIVSPVIGLLIFDTGTNSFQFYNGASWVELSTGAATNYWTQTGNNLTNNNTGNIGINLATPSERLQVDGNLKLGTAPWSSAANDRFIKIGDGSFVTIGETGQDDRMQLAARNFVFLPSSGGYPGNIGIGLSAPTSPLSFAQVLGDKINLWNTDATHNYGLGVQAGVLQIHSNDNTAAIAFGNGNSTTFNETVRFTGAGKVGIGTTTPSSMLEIKPAAGTADIELTGATAGNAVLRLNPTVVGANADIQFKNSGTINWDMGEIGNTHFAIKHAPTNNTIMDIDNVTRHIGFFTNDFTEDVNISGNLSTNGGVISKGGVGGFQFRDRTLNNYSGWNWYADNGKANLYRYTSGGDLLTIDATGNLGIGISTPASPLSFAQVLGDKINLWNTDATHNYGLGVQGGLFQIHANDNTSDIVFGNGSSAAFNETVRFTGSGNVGIGVNPTAKLEVNGQMKITGGTPGAGKVLTSDASGLATWAAQAYGNQERFRFYYSGAIFIPSTFYEEFDLINTEYNYSGNTVLNAGANTITFNKAGLYHIEVNGRAKSNTQRDFVMYIVINGVTKSHYYQPMVLTTGGFYNAGINNSFDIYFTAGTVISIRDIFESGTTVQDGYITGHLISE